MRVANGAWQYIDIVCIRSGNLMIFTRTHPFYHMNMYVQCRVSIVYGYCCCYRKIYANFVDCGSAFVQQINMLLDLIYTNVAFHLICLQINVIDCSLAKETMKESAWKVIEAGAALMKKIRNQTTKKKKTLRTWKIKRKIGRRL